MNNDKNNGVSDIMQRISRRNPIPIIGSLMDFGSVLFDDDNVVTSTRGLTGTERIQQYYRKQNSNTNKIVNSGLEFLMSLISMVF